MHKEALKRGLQLYLSSALIYGLALILFRYEQHYRLFLRLETQRTLLYLYAGFIVLAPFYYALFAKPDSENKPYLLMAAARRYISGFLDIHRHFSLEKNEKTALLFMLVKLFFIPVMLNFFYSNLFSLTRQMHNIMWYPFALTLIFTLDTFIFAFGYLFEFRILRNAVRSVEPTFFGWLVALVSYPPFNGFVGAYIPWGAGDYVKFWNPAATSVMRIAILFFLVIYLWASVALGTKASNLTNRGIVARFPYSVIRHPAYVSKNIVWWLTLLPVMSIPFALGMLFWTFIYFCRAITEERHLGQDPEYAAYCSRVKWRFVPWIF